MEEKRTVYRIRYTLDNRIKSIEASQEPAGKAGKGKAAGWIVVAVGVVLCVVWWLLW